MFAKPMLCKITENILCSDNISSWSRPKPASDDHVKNGELKGLDTSPRHQPHSPAHQNKERFKDTEVLTNFAFPHISLVYTLFDLLFI